MTLLNYFISPRNTEFHEQPFIENGHKKFVDLQVSRLSPFALLIFKGITMTAVTLGSVAATFLLSEASQIRAASAVIGLGLMILGHHMFKSSSIETRVKASVKPSTIITELPQDTLNEIALFSTLIPLKTHRCFNLAIQHIQEVTFQACKKSPLLQDYLIPDASSHTPPQNLASLVIRLKGEMSQFSGHKEKRAALQNEYGTCFAIKRLEEMSSWIKEKTAHDFMDFARVVRDRLPHLNLYNVKNLPIQEHVNSIKEWMNTNSEDFLAITKIDSKVSVCKILPKEISVFKNLTYLKVSCSDVRVISAKIGELTQLTNLDVSFNKLTALPDSIGELTQLTNLNAGGNQLTALPDSIGKLTQLTNLDVSGHHFYVGDNQLTALPDSIRKLTQLTCLDVSFNKLTALPDSIGKLTQLIKLNVVSNRLKALPDSIGKLTQLKDLDVDGNQLIALPDSIGNLTQLNHLYVNDNQLTALPESIEKLNQRDKLAHGGLSTINCKVIFKRKNY